MARFQRILCLVEFSAAGYQAVRYADALALRHGAAVTLLHVASAAELQLSMARPGSNNILGFSGGRNRRVEFAEASYPGQNPASEVLSLARKEGSDLIVMPAHPPGRVRRLLPTRSPLAAVLARAECPVIAGTQFPMANLAAPRDAASAPAPVLCCVELGAEDATEGNHLVTYAASIARGLEAPLTLLHASTELSATSTREDLLDENWRLTPRGRLGQELLRLQQDCGTHGDVVVEPGDVHEAIARAAQRLGAGMVVLGRRRLQGLSGRLLGHVPRTFWSAPCPVLSR